MNAEAYSSWCLRQELITINQLSSCQALFVLFSCSHAESSIAAAEGGDGTEQRPHAHAHDVESAIEQGRSIITLFVSLSVSLFVRKGFLKLPTMQTSLDVD